MIARFLALTAVGLLAGAGSATAQVRGAVRPPAPRPPAIAPKAVPPAARAPAPVARPSAPPPTPRPPASTARANAVRPRVNGNAAAANTPQHRYGIFRTDTTTGQTRLHKVGVSGGGTRTGAQLPKSQRRATLNPARDYSNRAVRQTNALNRAAVEKKEAATYSSRILGRVAPQSTGAPTARRAVLGHEQQTVTRHAVKRGTPPPGNKLPQPSPFSRLPKK